jgi:hypothetical protein
MSPPRSLVSLVGFALLGCGAGTPAAAEIPPHTVSAELEACAGARLDAGASIDDVTAQLEALPTRSAACLVAALPRPFGLVASSSTLSAQPAAGADDPRIFVMLPELVLSVVARGAMSSAIELGEWVTPTRTLKGELKLVDPAPLDEDSPFHHIVFGDNQTLCAQCHRNEEPADRGVARFVSDALRPDPASLLRFSELAALHAACVRDEDPAPRCALYHALFDFGDVSAASFSPELKRMGAL